MKGVVLRTDTCVRQLAYGENKYVIREFVIKYHEKSFFVCWARYSALGPLIPDAISRFPLHTPNGVIIPVSQWHKIEEVSSEIHDYSRIKDFSYKPLCDSNRILLISQFIRLDTYPIRLVYHTVGVQNSSHGVREEPDSYVEKRCNKK